MPNRLPPPKPNFLPKTTIEEIAHAIAQKMGYEPGGDLLPLTQEIGGTPFQPNQPAKSIRVLGPRNFQFQPLGATLSKERKAAALAHEIGHYVLHSQSGELPIERQTEGSDLIEQEANWFSAGFLIPIKKFLCLKAQGIQNWEIAEQFQTSITTVDTLSQRKN